jgi:uncharacterized protein YuzE
LIQFNYDNEADVMYISFGKPKPCCRKDTHGIIVGFDSNKKLNGITIIDYKSKTSDIEELTVTVPAVDAANNVRVEICPRCEGHGTLGMYVFRNPPEAKICSSCNGTGKLSPVA